MLDRLFASIREGLLAVDTDLRYRYVNDAALQMTGLWRDEVIGRTVAEVLPADVGAQTLPHIHSASATTSSRRRRSSTSASR